MRGKEEWQGPGGFHVVLIVVAAGGDRVGFNCDEVSGGQGREEMEGARAAGLDPLYRHEAMVGGWAIPTG